jgi:putative ABC transport system permease protein
MLKHNLLLIFRSFKRNKSTFIINLVGLSAGLTCTLLIYLWMNDELTKDRFHENGDRIFQVITNQDQSGKLVTVLECPGLLGEVMAQQMPEVEVAVSATRIDPQMTLSIDNKHITAGGRFADHNYLNVFSYPLLAGERGRVLKEKNEIVLSEETALRLFANVNDALGKSIDWQTPYGKSLLVVTGVFRNPKEVSEPADIFLSYELFKALLGEDIHWGNHSALVFVRLREDADPIVFNERIKHFVKEQDKKSNLTLFAQPFGETYLYNHYEGGVVSGGRIEYVRLFGVIAIVILAIACINFMNLSTAKATRRLTEVGIKKAVGAKRSSLVIQYMNESLLLSLISMLVALLAVDLVLPSFNTITGKDLSLDFNGTFVLACVCVVIFTGLLAGSYPALHLSGFKPAAVLKGKFTSSITELWARQGLVVFQFMISIVFIVTVWVVYRQISFIQTKNLGYDRDNIIHFKLEGSLMQRRDAFIEELRQIPGVVNASSMGGSFAGLTNFTTGYFDWEGRNQDEIVQFEHLSINYDMIEMLDIKLAEGRSFSRDFPGDSNKIILNEAAIKVMGVKNPVGKIFNLWGNNMEIIGVVKDFHFQSLHTTVNPFFFRLKVRDADKIMVKIKNGSETESLEKIKTLFSKINPGYPFDYRFLDQDYQALYESESRVASLSKYFAGLAILISCLGLFGLAAFTAERRKKEIGIRKVMGSTTTQIFILLSTDFTKMVLLAIVLAVPISYFLIQMWLENFAFRIELEWWFFAGAGVASLVIAWLTVSIQSFKAAASNPTSCLRNE